MSLNSDMLYGRQNLDYMESVYEDFVADPLSVDERWRTYFQNMDGYQPPSGLEALTPEDEPTGTYDTHLMADEHPIIHRVDEDQTGGVKADDIPPHIFDFISRVPLFQGIPQSDIARLAGITREIMVEPHQYLGRTGQTNNDLYLIRSGCVSIMRKGREITELYAGELIGELAVFDFRPRSADIMTKTSCRLLQMPRLSLHELLADDSVLTVGLLSALSVRLRDAGSRQERVDKLVRAYRERGHVLADLDPLGIRKEVHPELTLEHYGFKEEDLDTKFAVQLGQETSGRSLGDIVTTLEKIYCQGIGAQFMHIDDLEVQEWIRIRLEQTGGDFKMVKDEQIRILRKLTDAEVFENFLHRKFVGAKRFSLEGSESLIPLLDYAVEEAGNHKIDEVVIGMAHRGRLNVLVNVMGKPAAQVFREFQDIDAELHRSRGDVKYHLGYGSNRVTTSGHEVHLSLCFNPSHLEFVAPVALGRVRAKQDRYGDTERARALPVIIHGDAAFIGQGVNQEVFNMTELPGLRIGGTVHVILNNQIGFTTDPTDSRSSKYCSDIARMLDTPIFHVNGEHPEAVCRVIRMAMEFREKFKRDVVIDMYGYRKYGHNEGDDPAFTQPLLYRHIKRRKTVREAFVDNLMIFGGLTKEESVDIATDSKNRLEEALAASKRDDYQFKHVSFGKGLWQPYKGGPDKAVPQGDTTYPLEKLVALTHKITELPASFTAHNKIMRFLKQQREMAKGTVNWGTGEALAFASLLNEGAHVRLVGQDAERGTFSHRHAVLHDNKNGNRYIPLKHLSEKQGRFEVYNSPLTETAVLGFEYGYSLEMPEGLVIWEAQFGDFVNVAQVIIDQFISSSEDKWSRLSGLCMFLPHGYEGQGPEHSSARLERFLMLSAEDNIQVVNLTTPAQLFHCLRRQVLRPLRKPLIVMSPKSLLRHARAVSSMEELAEGRFQRVIPESGNIDAKKVKRVLLCSGKIYYELLEKREKEGIENVGIVRLEQYYPLPIPELADALSVYPKDVPVVWVQEEPLNMGAWSFLLLRLGEVLKGNGRHPFNRVARPESASPATGSAASHKNEQELLLNQAFNLDLPGWPQPQWAWALR